MRSLCPILILLFIGCSAEKNTSVIANQTEQYSTAKLKIAKLDSDFAWEMRKLDSLVGPIDSDDISHQYIEVDDSGRPVFRAYDTRCNCEPPLQGSDGKPRVPQNLPYADYANDTSLWYWSHPSKEFPDIKVYELKPQYVDSFLFPDGRWFQAPKWIVADWKKDAQRRYRDSILVNGFWVLVDRLEYKQWLKHQTISNP